MVRSLAHVTDLEAPVRYADEIPQPAVLLKLRQLSLPTLDKRMGGNIALREPRPTRPLKQPA
jgi:hypothetical protein